jgi:hypothetical protein
MENVTRVEHVPRERSKRMTKRNIARVALELAKGYSTAPGAPPVVDPVKYVVRAIMTISTFLTNWK